MIRAFLTKVGILSNKKPTNRLKKAPRIIARDKHSISRQHISENALKVLYRLNKHGFDAYLVGGGVRDLLLQNRPKDFDVVTNAKPEEVRRIFRNCRLIARPFRLAHVYFGYDIIEVATFRGKALEANEDHMHSEEGMILRDNVYGTIEEDVLRRDFTINALYYNIADFSIVDYVNGMDDLKAKRLKMIGDPQQRFREDPVRMLRAIRFASKTKFKLTHELKQAIRESKSLIANVSASRLYEEIIKMFHSGAAVDAYVMLKEENLFNILFPQTDASLKQASFSTDLFLTCVFESTDQRLKENKSVNPSFVIAALLWSPICIRASELAEKGQALFPARMKAIEEILSAQIKRVSMPKRISQTAREIWLMQLRLERRQSRRLNEIIEEPRFRAAYDFLELREKAGEPLKEITKWWKQYAQGDIESRKGLVKSMEKQRPRKRTRKRTKKSSEDK